MQFLINVESGKRAQMVATVWNETCHYTFYFSREGASLFPLEEWQTILDTMVKGGKYGTSQNDMTIRVDCDTVTMESGDGEFGQAIRLPVNDLLPMMTEFVSRASEFYATLGLTTAKN